MIEFTFTANDDKWEGTTNIVDSNSMEAIEATKEFIKSIIKAIKANAADEKEEGAIRFDLEEAILEAFNEADDFEEGEYEEI